MKFTDEQLAAAGFTATGHGHALTLANGNRLLIPSAHSSRRSHFATEYYRDNLRQMVAVYYLENAEDLAAVAVGACIKTLCRAQ